MIRSSKHTLKFSNISKLEIISVYLSEYRVLVQSIIDYIWNNSYQDYCPKQNKLDIPKFLDSSFLKLFNCSFTERLKQCAGKHALSMLSAATELRRKQLWKLKDLQQKHEPCKSLQRKISLNPLIKPNASNINLELDPRFVDFEFGKSKDFLCFVRIHGLKPKESFNIPIKTTKVFEKWNNKGKLKNSVIISKNNIYLIFEVQNEIKKESGNIVGCDQGITDLITLSDSQTTPLYQNKYSMTDVLNRISRRKKGSKGFKKAQDFRTNFINWSINQLDFSNIKELRIEKLYNVRKYKSTKRFLQHWTYTIINNKLKRVSEEKGFQYREVPNEFRSQRCNRCGWVRKSNRKGKTFCCAKCGYAIDADLNAASNLEIDLFEIPRAVRYLKLNRKGFYWKPDGLYFENQELIVLDTEKE